MTGEIDRRRRYPTALLFALFFVVLFALHTPLLRLPYFWDEAGYYVPAARDLLLHAELIQHSTRTTGCEHGSRGSLRPLRRFIPGLLRPKLPRSPGSGGGGTDLLGLARLR